MGGCGEAVQSVRRLSIDPVMRGLAESGGTTWESTIFIKRQCLVQFEICIYLCMSILNFYFIYEREVLLRRQYTFKMVKKK